MNRPAPMTVMFCDRMQATEQGGSPSAAKPAQVMAAWRAEGLPLRVLAPSPASTEDLGRAHAPSYVANVLSLRSENGFGTHDPDVARSLPFTSGAMLDGARVALAERTAVCAPVSGFHHAGYAHGWGFCTFNGLMVTALALLAEGRATRVAILDCDQHHGDGTDHILQRLGRPSAVRHFTAGARFRRRDDVAAFFEALDHELASLDGVDVVLYQAGADPHVNDPLGGWLTTEQLRERDARVFEGVAKAKVPIVWNLAGGYQRDPRGGITPVLEIHTHTAREHLRVFCSG